MREAVGKLRLNDASFTYEMETSAALGFGFRCGFLGLLHLEIIRERLEREFDIDLIATAPSVIYRVHLTDGTVKELHNPADMPEPQKIAKIEEPWIEATILVPDEHLGAVLKLCEDRRGRQKNLTYAGSRAMLVYELPLNEVVFDFYDRLKSVSRGYASFDYHIIGYEEGDLVKMALLVNDEPVDALSIIVHRGRAEARGRAMVEKLKDLIPRHLFKIPIQAAIGGKVIARETISAHAQGRDRQMLWRRHHAQAQAARQAEGGQEEDAELRPRRHPARGLHRRAEDGRGLALLGGVRLPERKARELGRPHHVTLRCFGCAPHGGRSQCIANFNRYSFIAVTHKFSSATAELSGSLILAYFQYFLAGLRQDRVIVVQHPITT